MEPSSEGALMADRADRWARAHTRLLARQRDRQGEPAQVLAWADQVEAGTSAGRRAGAEGGWGSLRWGQLAKVIAADFLVGCGEPHGPLM